MPEEQLPTFTIDDKGIGFDWGSEGPLKSFIEFLTMIEVTLKHADKSEKNRLKSLQNVAYDAKYALDDFLDEISRNDQKKDSVALRLSIDRKVKKFTDAINDIRDKAPGSGPGFTFLQHENTAQESPVVNKETEKLNGATGTQTKKNTHRNLGQENAESSCKSSPVVTEETKKLNGATGMETKKNTHRNLGLENAESSCKSSPMVTEETEKLNGATRMETKKNTHRNLGQENDESSCKSSLVVTEETEKLNGATGMETKKNMHRNLGQENTESSCKSSLVVTEETEKLNGATGMETKNNTHRNLGQENAESSCKSSLVVTEKTEKLNGAMGMETKKNTHRNLGQENAESSCKSSPVVTEETEKLNGATGMETKKNMHRNLGQENTESSCKSKTVVWALLVTSVVLEATSACCDQLGYALTSMVMAFLALFLSILDLILKARERGITCDGRSLLPCFYRHSSHDFQNRKPFASLVQYFGLAAALWQCCFTTVGYHYTHQKLVNPIKLCLLPFILALCVLISKVVKSSQHES